MKILLLIALVVLLLGSYAHIRRVAQKNQAEMSRYSLVQLPNVKTGKTLVVYYSLGGHTRKIAEKIARITQGDLYEITTVESLPKGWKTYWKMYWDLRSEKYPLLQGDLPNFSAYDTIFVGGPVWWYAPALPLLSFLQKADFQRRKVVPFSTQGSNYGSFEVDFKQMAQNAKLRRFESFNNLSPEYESNENNKIVAWINSID